jgi:hypothetical protein
MKAGEKVRLHAEFALFAADEPGWRFPNLRTDFAFS